MLYYTFSIMEKYCIFPMLEKLQPFPNKSTAVQGFRNIFRSFNHQDSIPDTVRANWIFPVCEKIMLLIFEKKLKKTVAKLFNW